MKNTVQSIEKKYCKWNTTLMAVFLLMSSGTAAQSVVSGLEANGVKTAQLEIIVAKPKQKPQKTIVQVNSRFEPGTIFVVPDTGVVWLNSNGNSQRLGPGSKHMASAGAKGESHQTFWGEVTHYVKNKLNFYTASGPSGDKQQGAVQGTIFTVTAVGRDVNFKTQEGRVAVQQKVPLNIAENSQSKRSKEHRLETTKTSYVDAGNQQTYSHNAPAEITYSSYAEAITVFQKQVDELYEDGEDGQYIVEFYTLLGELYLDSGDAEGAIDSFETAIDLYIEELDPNNPLLGDNYLGLAEAYFMANEQEKGMEVWNKAVIFIVEDMENNKIDLNYFIAAEDYDTAWGVGWNFVDNLDNLGWAYDLINDTEQSSEFYRMAREIEVELE